LTSTGLSLSSAIVIQRYRYPA